jgi:hypothetical protein
MTMDGRLYTDLAPPLPGNVINAAHTETAYRRLIPPIWRGKVITVATSGSDLYFLLGNANSMIEKAEVAQDVATPEVLAANWASGALIPAGSTVPVYVPDDDTITHYVVDSEVASGRWSAWVSSGTPVYGEPLPAELQIQPLMWIDAGMRHLLTVDSGAVTVSNAKCRVTGVSFSEATNKPDLQTPAGAASGLIRSSLDFITGSSEKLVCTNAALAAALGGANPFTLYLNTHRGATGAAHTVLSVGTDGSNNGRWDVTYNASDDIVITRVTSDGASTTSTFATTINAANSILITFDGSTPLLWVDGTSQTLTGTAAGNVGTTTKVALGCRAYNTSTADQFANVEICDALVFPEAFTGEKLEALKGWIRRRSGK